MHSGGIIIRSTRIVVDGEVRAGVVHIRDEKIERVELEGEQSAAAANARLGDGHASVLDVGDLVVMPGLVDTHVHVNEPGRTDWEGFVTAGRAAAAGGITTIVVMPLNCTPAATNVPALLGEAEAAAGKCLVDYGFWGGVVPGNVDELEPMWRAGALGFKAFMVESGVDDFGPVAESEILCAVQILRLLGAPLLVHAEDAALIESKRQCLQQRKPRSYREYAASRPAFAEKLAIEGLECFALLWKPRLHVVHVAASEALPIVESVAQRGLDFTAETCPHYLTFCSEQIPDGATQYKCAPPIRDERNREALWNGLAEGSISMVVSDHSPCPPALKCLDSGDFMKAWGGISSLQLGLSATWTGASARGFALQDIAQWMCENPAKLAGIEARKGRIAPGFDADLVVFDPDEEWTVRGESLHHRHKLTPYDGTTLRGVVKRTILRGRTIYDAAASNPFPVEPIGQWIKRDT